MVTRSCICLSEITRQKTDKKPIMHGESQHCAINIAVWTLIRFCFWRQHISIQFNGLFSESLLQFNYDNSKNNFLPKTTRRGWKRHYYCSILEKIGGKCLKKDASVLGWNCVDTQDLQYSIAVKPWGILLTAVRKDWKASAFVVP